MSGNIGISEFMTTKYLKKHLLVFLFCSIFFAAGTLSSFAQDFERLAFPFIHQDDTLAFPLVGGLNNPQFSAADLNNNGLLDLVIFDKRGDVLLTFLNSGIPNQAKYEYAPQYEKNFPPMRYWMKMKDFNGDGAADIFTYSNIPGIPGIVVHKGYYDANNELQFNQINFGHVDFQVIKFPDFNSIPTILYVSNEDIPEFVDVDGDGDLDILTFNFAGGYVEYYKNRSVELGYGTDTLIYVLQDNCWGRFYESGFSIEIDLSPSPDSCMFRQFLEPDNPEIQISNRHAGSTLLAFDATDNGKVDLLLGDITFSSMVMVYNTGTTAVAHMTSQDAGYPSNDVPVDLPVFPAGFYLDVDNDGKKDLLVSPNQVNASENHKVAWYYKNVSNTAVPDFELQQKDFLVDEMIDLGTGAYPAVIDYNNDGLPDLVIGNNGYYNPFGLPHSRLHLYENIGTPTSPAFKLVDDDYLGLSALGMMWLAPAFGDITGNGAMDLIVGEEGGSLVFLENTAGPDAPLEFAFPVLNFQGFNVGKAATPLIVDLDMDGRMDLVVGARLGNVTYFRNQTTQDGPLSFTMINNALGGIDTRPLGSPWLGLSAPAAFYQNGQLQIISGGYAGGLYHYNQIESNLAGTFNKVTEHLGNINVGVETRLAFADLNQSGTLELIVGNARGGITIFSSPFTAEEAPLSTFEPSGKLNIYPNPASDKIFLEGFSNNEAYTITDIHGREIQSGQISASGSINLYRMAAGYYILQVNSGYAVKRQGFVIK